MFDQNQLYAKSTRGCWLPSLCGALQVFNVSHLDNLLSHLT